MSSKSNLPRRENYLNFILSQLSELEGFTFRKMFGGIGFYSGEGLMFGAILGGKFRLRAPEACAGQHKGTSYVMEELARQYCEVPEEVIDNKNILKDWAEKAIFLARRTRGKS